MDRNIVELFDQFIKTYNEPAKNDVWKKQSGLFRDFWKNRILNKKSPPLTDDEIDEVIRILDINAKGRTRGDEAVARVLIPQNQWRSLFRQIREDERLAVLLDRIFKEQSKNAVAILLDELYEQNKDAKNRLTGKTGNGINALIAAYDPFNRVSIVSLNDRAKLMEYLGFDNFAAFNNLSFGERITKSCEFILEAFRKQGINANARTISSFSYSPSMRSAWKESDEEADDGTTDTDEDASNDWRGKRYWIYAPGTGASMWDEFYAEGIMAIGWSELGDLQKYQDKDAILRALTSDSADEGAKTHQVAMNHDFCHVVKPGDIVIAKRGRKEYIGYGIVASDYQFDHNRKEYCSYRKVDWKKKGSWPEEGAISMKTLTDITKDRDYVNKLVKLIGIETGDARTETVHMPDTALNTILYGPPGTGKTYNTINHAIGIVDPEYFSKQPGRKELRSRYESLVASGRIWFTTFHQSMGYEDFVEGIKPVVAENNSDAVSYQVKSGIFMTACAMAAHACYKAYQQSKGAAMSYGFDELYDAFVGHLRDMRSQGTEPVFKTIQGRDVGVKDINKNDSIIARAVNSIAKASAPLTKENLQKLHDRFKSIEEIKDLGQVKEAVEITPRITEFYAVFSGLKQFEKEFAARLKINPTEQYGDSVDEAEIVRKFNSGVFNEAVERYHDKSPKVVLIIDEINRGNVSQVFGELITLLEEDKRWGNKEGLSVVLPYSKSRFFVPPNLYLVGTMNTADRSVEALDIALRRRFHFIEMAPDYDLPALNRTTHGVVLRELLETINQRIEKLLDRDHVIGHSYFMSDPLDLPGVFQNKIIPLLQEYFFGDYGKIGLVIGRGFIERKDFQHAGDLFASFEYDEAQDLAERPVYRIHWPSKMKPAEFDAALEMLMRRR